MIFDKINLGDNGYHLNTIFENKQNIKIKR